MIQVTASIAIDPEAIEESFIRSSGPGGQNVNMVSTAVQLRFDLKRAENWPEAVRARLRRLAGQRLTQDDTIVITARQYRTRERNREDARERLVALVRAAAQPPKARRATRPTLASKRRRLETKRKSSDKKRMRAKPDI